MAKRRSPPPLKRAPDSPKMRRWPLLLSMLAASPAAAQPAVTAVAPEKVSVSVFRDPGRDEGGEISPNWLEGFALISETRTVDLPAGEANVRFEGVAEGMIAVSAIVTGLPGGETGRASCRGRVCQYGSISVVPVS